MKKIPNPFDWYPRDFWYWPDHDEKLLQVIHQVHDLDRVLPLIPNKRVCIQAGGACGVWPAYLSLHFDLAVAFEADYSNYMVCIKNGARCHHLALSDKGQDYLCVDFDSSESRNSGAKYVAEQWDANSDEWVLTSTIDEICEDYQYIIDFICLDVEGFEHKALLGAKETIERCSPVIMIEEKPLPHLQPGEHLKARQYLESIGYKEVLKVNRDVVFIR